MRYSKHRQQIYRFVCESREHPTAQMVYDALRREEPRLSLGTVYRNLNQLADAGQLKKISLPDGSCRFDGTLSRHSHIICERCGRVEDVSVDAGWLSDLVARETRFSLTSVDLVMRGVCGGCADGAEATAASG